MTTPLRKSRPKQSNVLKKIKVEGEVDEGQKVIVGRDGKTTYQHTRKSYILSFA